MKNLKLENLGVQEMNTTEMTKVEGGGFLNDLLFNTLATVGLTAGILLINALAFVKKEVNDVLTTVLS